MSALEWILLGLLAVLVLAPILAKILPISGPCPDDCDECNRLKMAKGPQKNKGE